MANQEILNGVILHALEYKGSSWGDVFYRWNDTDIFEAVKDCENLDKALDRIAIRCGFFRKFNEEEFEKMKEAHVSYIVAGSNEKVDNPKEYLEKEEDYCRQNPEFLENFWSNDGALSADDYDFDKALGVYLDGLREDVKDDPRYQTQTG